MTGRIVGVLLIGAISLYIGGAVIHFWQKRVEQLAAFCRLLSALEDGIGKMGLPIQTIAASFSDSVLESVGFLPEIRRICAEDGTVHAFGDAFDACLPNLSAEEEERMLLRQFFASLGTEDRVRETERCAYVQSRLQALRTEAEDALPARCRIARTLSGAVGCAAALMLL